MTDPWISHWNRTLNHEGVTRGMQALLALTCVLALGWHVDAQGALMPVILGVMASAFTESDDNWSGRLKAQLLALTAFALVMAAVWAALPSYLSLALVLALCAFVLTLLGALGERYRAIAFGALVLFIYTALSADNNRDHALEVAPYLLGGAAWYGLVSLCWAAAWPRPTVRHRLSTLYALLGEYLRLKAQLLEPVSDIDLAGRRLALALHNGRVVDALNSTKESLFSRLGAGPAPAWLQEAMHQYLAAQDIHERVSSSHESYAVLAQAFPRADALYRCQRVLSVLGEQALKFARALRERTLAQHGGTTARALADMQAALQHLDATQTAPALQQPLRALHALGDNLTGLARVFASAMGGAWVATDLSLFDRQPQSLREAWSRVRAQLSLRSSLLRHALRLSLALLVAFALMRATHDPHGYWILLTVVFTSQPHYAATLSRAVQRAVGTVAGLAVGWALIRLFPGALLQSACMVLAGALFIGKRQTDLRIAAAAITALVLLSFHQLGMSQGVIPARLLDAAWGSAISALAAWLVLPNWQARHLPHLAAQALRAQAGYLQAILPQYHAGKQDHLAYRLARRNAHNADAALANAFGAMRKEPVRTRLNEAACAQFVVLSHMLLNFLSAMGAHRGDGPVDALDDTTRQTAEQLQRGLHSLAQLLDRPQATWPVVHRSAHTAADAAPDGQGIPSLLLSQLRLASALLPALGAQALLFRAPAQPTPETPPAE